MGVVGALASLSRAVGEAAFYTSDKRPIRQCVDCRRLTGSLRYYRATRRTMNEVAFHTAVTQQSVDRSGSGHSAACL